MINTVKCFVVFYSEFGYNMDVSSVKILKDNSYVKYVTSVEFIVL